MAQRKYKRNSRRTRRILSIVMTAFLMLIITQLSLVDASHATTSTFEEILEPLQTIYDLVKFTATVIAGLIMLFAGLTYISSGSDPGKREKAKNMVMYVIIGLMVIWAAPFVVELILG